MDRAIPILPGDDLAVMKSFYVDKLGFETTFESTEDGKSGLAGVARGTIEITLDCPMPGHGRDACVALEVGDADALYEEWRAMVELPDPPRNEEWGSRTFGLQDPAGNTLFVIGPIK